jgi:Kef-type K+ transport systems, membrane components
MEISSILAMLAVLIILAYIGSKLFEKFDMPGLIGEIIIGIIIANFVIGDWSLLDVLDIDIELHNENYNIIELFAELGVIFLLFSIGLKTRVCELLSVGRAAMLVAFMGVLIPFVAGFALIQVYDGNMHHALFMGAALVATSVGITAKVIKDMKLLDAKESKIIIGAAVIDDVLGMIVLAIVVAMTQSADMAVSNIVLITAEALIFVVVIIALCLWVVPKLYASIDRRTKARIEKTGNGKIGIDKLILAIVVCLSMAWFADLIGLAAIIGAFLGGMLLADCTTEWKIEEKVEAITTFFISFFFLHVGMQVVIGDLMSLTVLALSAIVIVIACVTKYFGCYLGAAIGDKALDRGSKKIIGVGMIPRGEVGIIVASIGYETGAMSSELYAVVVLMAVATTIIAPPLFARAFKKKYPPESEIMPNCGCTAK